MFYTLSIIVATGIRTAALTVQNKNPELPLSGVSVNLAGWADTPILLFIEKLNDCAS